MRKAFLAGLIALLPPVATAQTPPVASNLQNEGNDPLTPKPALMLQDYFQPILNGQPASGANQLILRGVLPYHLFGWPQLARLTVPIDTAYGPDVSVTGLGDTTLFDIPLFFAGSAKFGVGPLLVLPTSTSRALGEGKWQLGGQGIVTVQHDWGLTGGFVSYQKAIDSPTQTITAQPLLFYNLSDGYYLRSAAIASFDLNRQSSVIPVGLGFGRVIALPNGNVLNAFVEPQYSVLRDGAGVPTFQVYVGFNLQFPKRDPGR